MGGRCGGGGGGVAGDGGGAGGDLVWVGRCGEEECGRVVGRDGGDELLG